MPERIQLRRTSGWRKPEGAVVVARPTKWGNPFRVGETAGDVLNRSVTQWQWGRLDKLPDDVVLDRERTVAAFRRWARSHVGVSGYTFAYEALVELRGRDLACWCPLDQPCHADVLLELANGAAS